MASCVKLEVSNRAPTCYHFGEVHHWNSAFHAVQKPKLHRETTCRCSSNSPSEGPRHQLSDRRVREPSDNSSSQMLSQPRPLSLPAEAPTLWKRNNPSPPCPVQFPDQESLSTTNGYLMPLSFGVVWFIARDGQNRWYPEAEADMPHMKLDLVNSQGSQEQS